MYYKSIFCTNKMSRFTSYTIEFTDGSNPDRERNTIDLSPYVISDFTHHMMGELSGSRRMRRRRNRPTGCRCRGENTCVFCSPRLLPEFNSESFPNIVAPPSLNMEAPSPLEQLANVGEIFSNPNLSEGIMSLMMPTNQPSRTRIPTFKCEGDLGECSICQTQMKEGDMICRLPCQDTVSHAFHSDCIKPLLQSNDTCPNCRSKI